MSVTSMIVGIAIDRGLIPGVDTPVLDFFPEYAALRSPEKNAITLEHLLTMSSGLEWEQRSTEYTNPVNDMYQFHTVPDPLGFVLGRLTRGWLTSQVAEPVPDEIRCQMSLT